MAIYPIGPTAPSPPEPSQGFDPFGMFDRIQSDELREAKARLGRTNPQLLAWMESQEQEGSQPYRTEDYLRASMGMGREDSVPLLQKLVGGATRGTLETLPLLLGKGLPSAAARLGLGSAGGAAMSVPARSMGALFDPSIASEDPATSMLLGLAWPGIHKVGSKALGGLGKLLRGNRPPSPPGSTAMAPHVMRMGGQGPQMGGGRMGLGRPRPPGGPGMGPQTGAIGGTPTSGGPMPSQYGGGNLSDAELVRWWTTGELPAGMRPKMLPSAPQAPTIFPQGRVGTTADAVGLGTDMPSVISRSQQQAVEAVKKARPPSEHRFFQGLRDMDLADAAKARRTSKPPVTPKKSAQQHMRELLDELGIKDTPKPSAVKTRTPEEKNYHKYLTKLREIRQESTKIHKQFKQDEQRLADLEGVVRRIESRGKIGPVAAKKLDQYRDRIRTYSSRMDGAIEELKHLRNVKQHLNNVEYPRAHSFWESRKPKMLPEIAKRKPKQYSRVKSRVKETPRAAKLRQEQNLDRIQNLRDQLQDDLRPGKPPGVREDLTSKTLRKAAPEIREDPTSKTLRTAAKAAKPSMEEALWYDKLFSIDAKLPKKNTRLYKWAEKNHPKRLQELKSQHGVKKAADTTDDGFTFDPIKGRMKPPKGKTGMDYWLPPEEKLTPVEAARRGLKDKHAKGVISKEQLDKGLKNIDEVANLSRVAKHKPEPPKPKPKSKPLDTAAKVAATKPKPKPKPESKPEPKPKPEPPKVTKSRKELPGQFEMNYSERAKGASLDDLFPKGTKKPVAEAVDLARKQAKPKASPVPRAEKLLVSRDPELKELFDVAQERKPDVLLRLTQTLQRTPEKKLVDFARRSEGETVPAALANHPIWKDAVQAARAKPKAPKVSATPKLIPDVSPGSIKADKLLSDLKAQEDISKVTFEELKRTGVKIRRKSGIVTIEGRKRVYHFIPGPDKSYVFVKSDPITRPMGS